MMARRALALLRAMIIAPAFVSLWMYFVPKWVVGARAFENPRPLGWIVVALGAAIGLPCVWQFAWRGLGTPAPFDPPRRLVVSGPYRWVRNPMYIGAGLTFLGEGIVYPDLTLVMLAVVSALFVFVTLFVVVYEEPTLRRMFGADYEAYCRAVRRWIPRVRPWYSSAHLD